jgi:heme-degrading monooxygenase HmoA
MFRAHDGYLGVLFGRDGESCIVVTLWETMRAAEAISASPLYQRTVRDIMAAGFLRSEGSVEVFEAHGFALPGGPREQPLP